MLENIKYQLTKQRHVREIFLLYLIVLLLFFSLMYTSLAVFEKEQTIENMAIVNAGELSLNITSTSTDYNVDTGDIIVSSGNKQRFNITLTNNTLTSVKYKLYYQLLSPATLPDGVNIGVIGNGKSSDILERVGQINVTKTITIVIINNSEEDVALKIGVEKGYSHNDIILPTDKLELNTITIPGSLSEKILADNPLIESDVNFDKITVSQEIYDTLTDSQKEESVVENGLYKNVDYDGNTYFFRGNVENNYVKFGGFIWRIVRINGDGTVRLILNDPLDEIEYNTLLDNEKYVGYTYDNSKICSSGNFDMLCTSDEGTDSVVKAYLDEWYKQNLASETDETKNFDNMIAETRYCNDTSLFSNDSEGIKYGGFDRISNNKTPNLICPTTEQTYGGEYKLKIGLLAADESAFAGMVYNTLDSSSYLNKSYEYLLLTPNKFYGNKSSNELLMYNINQNKISTSNSGYILPVINLNFDVIYSSGDGTSTTPYEVELAK